MIRRALAALAALACLPAQAMLVEYRFTAEIDGFSSDEVSQTLGVEVGDTFSGGFFFDDGAPTLAFESIACGCSDGSLDVDGFISNATYDMSRASIWALVGNQAFSSYGETLQIQDIPNGALGLDAWHLRFATARIFLNELMGEPLDNAELRVPDLARFDDVIFGRRLLIGEVGSHLTSMTQVSVPEPGTLLLLSSALGLSLLRKRRRA